jgi:integrase/recombinase XerD
MKIERDSTQHLKRQSPRLRVIQSKVDNLAIGEIVCPDCNSREYHKAGIARNGKQKYRCKSCQRRFIEEYEDRPGESDDVLSATKLGLRVNYYQNSGDKINFSNIRQLWFKDLAIRHVRYKAGTRELGTLRVYLTAFRSFSYFLLEADCVQGINDISRAVIIDYIDYLSCKKLTPATKNERIGKLADFFETGVVNNWFDVSPHLIRKEDYQTEVKPLPRYIPEEVMRQVNQHLDALPAPIMRVVLVMQECGLRIGELCLLPFDCLKQDTKGRYYIQFMRWKMKKETTLPISIELSVVIKEQQQYIRDNLGEEYRYLFCGRSGGDNKNFLPESKVMTIRSFSDCIKKLFKEFDIRDNSGKLWNFQTHQFRHTVGTRMINNGVPQHIIQRYLGHDSPQMTMVYAHIHDETLRQEVEKYHETRVVNFQGESATLDATVLSSNDDLEWFKKNVQARALEHGYCARPKLLGDCDIPGFDGCYNCPHWRTNQNFLPILQDTLERTNKVLEKARNCGWELQSKKNEPIRNNLEKVIKSLETECNE